MTNNLLWRCSFWTKLWPWFFWIQVLLTLWLSLIPADQVPSGLNFWDKAQHAIGFMALGLLGLKAYPERTYTVLLGLALLGVGIEVAQWLTGWRNGDWQDWIADVVGLMLGYLSWKIAGSVKSSQQIF